MAQLQPAGFLASLASFVVPKKLAAHVRTETLPNGEVQITPVFTIDGYEVASELIWADSSQNILGYTATMDRAVQHVHKETQGKETRLTKRKAAEFLTRLSRSGIPVQSKDRRSQPRISEVRPDVSLKLHPDDTLSVDSVLTTNDGVIVEKPRSIEQLKQDEGWYAVGDDLLRVASTGTSLDKVLLNEGGNGPLIGDNVPRFLKMLQENAQNVGEVEKNDKLQQLSIIGKKIEHQATVDGDTESISISTALVFHGTKGRKYEQTAYDLMKFDDRKGGFQRVPEGWLDVTTDAIEGHRKACQELGEKIGGLANIRGEAIPVVLRRLAEGSGRDAAWNTPWAVYFSQAVQNSHRLVDIPSNVEFRLNIVERDGRSLLELDPIYNHDRFRLTHNEVENTANSGESWVRRRDAWIKVDLEKYGKIAAGVQSLGLQRSDNGYTFPASQREPVIDLFSVLGSIRHSAAFAEFLAKLADFDKIEDVPLPTALRSEIRFRPYQKHGYNWLAFLHRFGLNGILADDMGLGKTLQTLAVIQWAQQMTNSMLPSLIVCPTSVVNNWKSEVQKFFRGCGVIVYNGSNREKTLRHLQALLGVADCGSAGPLVVTSYDVARIDHEKLNQISWLYVVVDEGHNIKNPDARRTKAIKTINGQHKLALTGTPIQNNLEELWSLFDFVMPGFLGSRTAFRDQYGQNGRINLDAVRKGNAPLKERVHPFILRRLKEKVEKELPPKIVVDLKVELAPLQVTLYKQVIDSPDYKRLVDEVTEKGVNRSRPFILAALTKLRAICNHPALAQSDRETDGLKYKDSGKLECLKELMEEVKDGEHRTLLFSQSTRMLNIIENCFPEWGISAIRLDGSTLPDKRSALVDQFNRTPAIHCFLISTKAGGTGLNLTGADTVIFYDHDWNPANDRQAQDRAYRIGQTKPVTVYRLVSKGTIEEKILERQLLKQSLADEIIGADEDGFKDLNKEELLALFKLDEGDD